MRSTSRQEQPPSPVALGATVQAARDLIESRFPLASEVGAAAMLLEDGTILTSTSPAARNPTVELCHETGAYCEAYRRGQRVVASVCLHRDQRGSHRVLSPCGVCMERLAVHGSQVLVAVPAQADCTVVEWVRLGAAHPHYWMQAFPEELERW